MISPIVLYSIMVDGGSNGHGAMAYQRLLAVNLMRQESIRSVPKERIFICIFPCVIVILPYWLVTVHTTTSTVQELPLTIKMSSLPVAIHSLEFEEDLGLIVGITLGRGKSSDSAGTVEGGILGRSTIDGYALSFGVSKQVRGGTWDDDQSTGINGRGSTVDGRDGGIGMTATSIDSWRWAA